MGFGEDFGEFVAGSFGRYLGDFGALAANGGAGSGFDFEFVEGRESHGPEEPEVVFGEPCRGVAYSADHFAGEVGLAVDMVDDLIVLGIEEEAVDGEVAAGGVLGGVCFESHSLSRLSYGHGARRTSQYSDSEFSAVW